MENQCHYLPTENGGFIRKHFSNMTPNEQKFIQQTQIYKGVTMTDKLKHEYQSLAKNLLFKETNV